MKVKVVKLKVIKDVRQFSVWQLLIFVLLFASIGGFFTLRSFGLVCACATGPTAPSNLTASAVSASQINLSWNGSTESSYSGGFYYHIYRNGSQIDVVTSTSWFNTGLSAGTTYSYSVDAYDSYGNASGLSTTASATTPALPPPPPPPNLPLPPTTPANLTAAAVSSSQINLSWTASTSQGDGVGGYEVFRNGVHINNVFTTSWSDTGLSAGTTYSYYLIAYSTHGEESGHSNIASVTTPVPPPPTSPTSLTAETLDDSEIDLSWNASTSSAGIAGYKIYRNGGLVGTTSSTTLSDTGVLTAYYDTPLPAATTYSYYVVAYDNSGTTSSASNTTSATTQSTIPSSAPGSFKATVTSASTVNLSWNASTPGQVGVKQYDIYEVTPPDDTDDNGVLDGQFIASTTGTSYQVTGLAASTGYGFYVIAVDKTDNFSDQSAEALATTNALGYALNVGLSASVTEIGAGQTGTVINTAISPNTLTCTKKFDSDGSALDASWKGSFSGISGYSQVVYPPSGSEFYTFYSYELSCTNGASIAVSGMAVRKYSDDVTN
jgi:fibronectin type 3 domain-containing protein